jgi:hypothetical protein
MKLDLTLLKQMHPLLPTATALEYAHRAALGLERHRHKLGVSLAVVIDSDRKEARLHWDSSPSRDNAQIDYHRITEDAAEAIALALVHTDQAWVIRRRLQRGEFADWLLVDSKRQSVALEVSGIDEADGGRRLREKIEQVRQASIAERKAACVVELAAPSATLANV